MPGQSTCFAVVGANGIPEFWLSYAFYKKTGARRFLVYRSRYRAQHELEAGEMSR